MMEGIPWFGLGAFTAGAQVQSLVGEIRSHKPCSSANKTKHKKEYMVYYALALRTSAQKLYTPLPSPFHWPKQVT